MLTDYLYSSGYTRKDKRREKKYRKKHQKGSITYLVFYVSFLTSLIFYKYLNFYGVLVVVCIAIGASLYIRRNKIKGNYEKRKNSGILKLDVMNEMDFKLAILLKYYPEKKFSIAKDKFIPQSDYDEYTYTVVRNKITLDEELVVTIKTMNVIGINIGERISDMQKTIGVDSLSIYTTGHIGSAATILDEDVYTKEREALADEITNDDIEAVKNHKEYTFVRRCPYCNSRLHDFVSWRGMMMKCSNDRCIYKVRKKDIE